MILSPVMLVSSTKTDNMHNNIKNNKKFKFIRKCNYYQYYYYIRAENKQIE